MQFADEILFSADCGIFPDDPDYEDESYNEYEGYPLDGHELLQYATLLTMLCTRISKIFTAT